MATTLLQIRGFAKDIADYQNNAQVSDPTWNRWINQAQEELYRFLFKLAPQRFYATASFTLSATNSTALAAGWRRVYGVTKDPTSQSLRTSLRQFNFEERDSRGQVRVYGGAPERSYDIQGNNLVIEPAQFAAGNYAYYYTVGPTLLALDADAISTTLEPYCDYIEHRAAVNTLGREESDTSSLRANLDQMRDDIEAEFGDSTEPSTIVDASATGGNGLWP